MSGIESLVVVVPVHDEQEVLDACLTSIALSARALRSGRAVTPPIVVAVVLDACTDASPDVAAAHEVRVVTTDARSVGVARGLGVDAAVAGVPAPAERVWVATTDADTRVPASWLGDHLAAAEGGHDLLVGPVLPDAEELDAQVLAAWHERHRTGRLHVHGANLGVRLSAYRAVGGFPRLTTGEDVELVRALLESGAPTVRQGRPVVTSARGRGAPRTRRVRGLPERPAVGRRRGRLGLSRQPSWQPTPVTSPSRSVRRPASSRWAEQ